MDHWTGANVQTSGAGTGSHQSLRSSKETSRDCIGSDQIKREAEDCEFPTTKDKKKPARLNNNNTNSHLHNDDGSRQSLTVPSDDPWGQDGADLPAGGMGYDEGDCVDYGNDDEDVDDDDGDDDEGLGAKDESQQQDDDDVRDSCGGSDDGYDMQMEERGEEEACDDHDKENHADNAPRAKEPARRRQRTTMRDPNECEQCVCVCLCVRTFFVSIMNRCVHAMHKKEKWRREKEREREKVCVYVCVPSLFSFCLFVRVRESIAGIICACVCVCVLCVHINKYKINAHSNSICAGDG